MPKLYWYPILWLLANLHLTVQKVEFEMITNAEERQANQLSLQFFFLFFFCFCWLPHSARFEMHSEKCFYVRNDRENCKHSTICVTGLYFILLIIRYIASAAHTHLTLWQVKHMKRNYHRTGTHNHIIININRLLKR